MPGLWPTWSPLDVSIWVSDVLRLGQYAHAFVHFDIDGPTLLELTEDVLESQLSIRNIIHRKKIIAHAKLLAMPASQPSTPSPSRTSKMNSPASRERSTRVDWSPEARRVGDRTSAASRSASSSHSPCASNDAYGVSSPARAHPRFPNGVDDREFEDSLNSSFQGPLYRSRSCELLGSSAMLDKDAPAQGYGAYSAARAAARRRQPRRSFPQASNGIDGSNVSASFSYSPSQRRRSGGVRSSPDSSTSYRSSDSRKVLPSKVPPASTKGQRVQGFGELGPSCSTRGSWGTPRPRQPWGGGGMGKDHHQFVPHSDVDPLSSHYYKASMLCGPRSTAINRADRKLFDLPWQVAATRSARSTPGPGKPVRSTKNHLGGAFPKDERFTYDRQNCFNWIRELESTSTVL